MNESNGEKNFLQNERSEKEDLVKKTKNLKMEYAQRAGIGH